MQLLPQCALSFRVVRRSAAGSAGSLAKWLHRSKKSAGPSFQLPGSPKPRGLPHRMGQSPSLVALFVLLLFAFFLFPGRVCAQTPRLSSISPSRLSPGLGRHTDGMAIRNGPEQGLRQSGKFQLCSRGESEQHQDRRHRACGHHFREGLCSPEWTLEQRGKLRSLYPQRHAACHPSDVSERASG